MVIQHVRSVFAEASWDIPKAYFAYIFISIVLLGFAISPESCEVAAW